MKVAIIREAGHEEALLGLSLSHGAPIERIPDRARRLAHLGGGHNKFLESIMLWIDVTAPRYWWSQADTYRMSTKQSQSTMHTLMRRELVQSDFENCVSSDVLVILDRLRRWEEFEQMKGHLPESFLQRRIWVMSYKTLQNIVSQRKAHKLKEWRFFCDEVLAQAEHQEFLAKNEERKTDLPEA